MKHYTIIKDRRFTTELICRYWMKHYTIIKDRRFTTELICSIQSINFLNDLHIYNIL